MTPQLRQVGLWLPSPLRQGPPAITRSVDRARRRCRRLPALRPSRPNRGAGAAGRPRRSRRSGGAEYPRTAHRYLPRFSPHWQGTALSSSNNRDWRAPARCHSPQPPRRHPWPEWWPRPKAPRPGRIATRARPALVATRSAHVPRIRPQRRNPRLSLHRRLEALRSSATLGERFREVRRPTETKGGPPRDRHGDHT